MYRVEPGERVVLADRDPDETEGFAKKSEVAELLDEHRQRLRALQGRLYAEHAQSLLIVLQAMDTGGKDGTVKHVFRGINPQGCHVWAFREPTAEELDHDVLWRYHLRTPTRGSLTIFNRSHYEEVVVVRVKGLVPEEVWRPRYDLLVNFERQLHLDRVRIVKFFLHISKDEQKRRLKARRDDPRKQWKFNPKDLEDRGLWDDYQAAYEEAISRTSTAHAPWYVIPANHKWYRNLAIARIIVDTLDEMDPQYPKPETDLENLKIPD